MSKEPESPEQDWLLNVDPIPEASHLSIFEEFRVRSASVNPERASANSIREGLSWYLTLVIALSTWFVFDGTRWLLSGMRWRKQDLSFVLFLYLMIICGALYFMVGLLKRWPIAGLALAIGVGVSLITHNLFPFLWLRIADATIYLSFLVLASLVFAGFWMRRRAIKSLPAPSQTSQTNSDSEVVR